MEAEVQTLLQQSRDLSETERYFLAETLGHVDAGRYELGHVSMEDVFEPPELSHAAYQEVYEAAKGLTHEALVRALRRIKAEPARDYPSFR